jgi:hypothetical protein
VEGPRVATIFVLGMVYGEKTSQTREGTDGTTLLCGSIVSLGFIKRNESSRFLILQFGDRSLWSRL